MVLSTASIRQPITPPPGLSGHPLASLGTKHANVHIHRDIYSLTSTNTLQNTLSWRPLSLPQHTHSLTFLTAAPKSLSAEQRQSFMTEVRSPRTPLDPKVSRVSPSYNPIEALPLQPPWTTMRTWFSPELLPPVPRPCGLTQLLCLYLVLMLGVEHSLNTVQQSYSTPHPQLVNLTARPRSPCCLKAAPGVA